jgi:starch synthase (maltosyl-transferring)
MNRLRGSPSISFADTHDTPRLAADLEGHVPGLMQRYLLAGLYSTGVMMVAGYEFGFRKRLHVVETGPEDWEPVRIDLTGFVRAVNELKSRHRVFHEESRIQTVDASNPRIFAMLKTSSDDAQRALVAINTDLDGSQRVKIEDLHRRLGYPRQFRDISPEGARNEVPDFYEDRLAPARCVVFCGER